jgi:hypothetical protein
MWFYFFNDDADNFLNVSNSNIKDWLSLKNLLLFYQLIDENPPKILPFYVYINDKVGP